MPRNYAAVAANANPEGSSDFAKTIPLVLDGELWKDANINVQILEVLADRVENVHEELQGAAATATPGALAIRDGSGNCAFAALTAATTSAGALTATSASVGALTSTSESASSLVSVKATGGGVDDWDRLFGSGAVVSAIAAAGKRAVFAQGAYTCNSGLLSLPDQATIVVSPMTSIVSTLTQAGGFPGHYPFHIDAPSTVQGAGTLAATPALGATVLSIAITTKPVVGHYIQLSHGVSAAVYKVVASSGGASPWSVTIDRPTNLPWTSAAGGDAVNEYASRPSDIVYKGAGTISGTGDQLFQIVRAHRVWIRGVNQIPTSGLPQAGIGFDLGCRDVLLENCTSDQTGSSSGFGQTAYFAQSTERAIFRHLSARNAWLVGAVLLDCVGGRLENIDTEGCSTGKSLSSFGTGPDGKIGFGCYDSAISGGTSANETIGAAISYVGPSYNNAIENHASIASTGFGLYVGAGAVSARLLNNDVRGSAVGVIVQPGAQDTVINGLRADNCTTVAVSIGSAVDLTGMTSTCSYAANGIIDFSGTDTWRCRGLTLAQNNAAGYVLYVTGAGRLEVDGALLAGSNAVGIFINAAATVVVKNTKITAAGQGIFVGAGATLILGDGVDLSGCASPFTGTGTVLGHFNGASAIAMTNADHTCTWAEYAVRDIALTGAITANHNLVLPKIGTPWTIKNGTDHQVTAIGSTGTGVAIATGTTARVRFDGTNFVSA